MTPPRMIVVGHRPEKVRLLVGRVLRASPTIAAYVLLHTLALPLCLLLTMSFWLWSDLRDHDGW